MDTKRSPKKSNCSQEGCEATFDDHYWGSVRAQDEGWFRQKTGENWCPEHNPEWVKEWRETKKREPTG